MVQYSNRANTCQQSEKDGTILKQGKNLSPVRKAWYKTERVQKPVTSKKKMVQYSNRAKTCQQCKKRWCNSQTVAKPANSQNNMVQYSEPKPVTSQKKMVQN